MKTFKLQYEKDFSDFDYLEKIYKKVKLGETVKINGKVYIRTVPKNNKFYKHPYHFYLSNPNIYKGDILIVDDDEELVTSRCCYKIIVTDN